MEILDKSSPFFRGLEHNFRISPLYIHMHIKLRMEKLKSRNMLSFWEWATTFIKFLNLNHLNYKKNGLKKKRSQLRTLSPHQLLKQEKIRDQLYKKKLLRNMKLRRGARKLILLLILKSKHTLYLLLLESNLKTLKLNYLPKILKFLSTKQLRMN